MKKIKPFMWIAVTVTCVIVSTTFIFHFWIFRGNMPYYIEPNIANSINLLQIFIVLATISIGGIGYFGFSSIVRITKQEAFSELVELLQSESFLARLDEMIDNRIARKEEEKEKTSNMTNKLNP